MNINSHTKHQGFTLVELMLALAISIFLIGGVVLIQSSSRAASMEAERLSRLQESIRFTSDLLIRDLRNAGFRDQLSLTGKEFEAIGRPFAKVTSDNGSDMLEIAYAGWGSCADGFKPVQETVAPDVIRNRYRVLEGQLQCGGSRGVGDEPTWRNLASGVNSVAYTLICAPGTACSTTDECNLWIDGEDFKEERRSLNETCAGVRIELEFEPPDGAGSPVSVEFLASFRNILLGRMMWQSVCKISNPPPEGCTG